MAQGAAIPMTFAVKTAGDPLAGSDSVRGGDQRTGSGAAGVRYAEHGQRMDRSLVSRRSPVVLSLAFGGVALFLSALGIYGVLAYLVTQRTEGDRHPHRAGQQRAGHLRARAARGPAAHRWGLVLGGAGAFALRKSLQSQLFGVAASDPLVLASVTGLLALVAVLACAVPARRATRIDPVVALTD